MFKLTKKKIILFAGFVFALCSGLVALKYHGWKKMADAAGAMPWQFGGTVNFYQPVCVATPPDGVCKNCPMCTTAAGPYTCAAFQEIQFTPATGSQPPNFVCPAQGFVYSGGGVVPRVGGYILGGGASSIVPWIIGISK